MRIVVDLALRERRCKCSKVIPKGTYHLRGDGWHDQENICPDCAVGMVAEMITKNEVKK